MQTAVLITIFPSLFNVWYRGAYLYRRERKKGGGSVSNSAGAGPAKRARHGFSDDGSSSSTQPDGELQLQSYSRYIL